MDVDGFFSDRMVRISDREKPILHNYAQTGKNKVSWGLVQSIPHPQASHPSLISL